MRCVVGNRNGRILLAVLDQDQPAVRLQRPADAPQHLLRMPELVVDVDEQRQIDGVVRQPVASVSVPCTTSTLASRCCRAFSSMIWSMRGWMSFAYTFPAGPTSRRQPNRHVAGAGADVGDDHPGLDANQLQRLLRGFLLFARGPIEPARVGRDAGNLPPGERVDRRRRAACATKCVPA